MKKRLFMVLAAAFLAGPIAAEEIINIKVKGMVCSFCAQGIEKKFKENPAVEAVGVALKRNLVTLKLKADQTLSDDEIEKIVLDAGYNIQNIKRDK